MSPPVISVITPCRNASSLIAETMTSVLTQSAVLSGRASLQYVVVDGASSDGTADIARAMGGPDVRVISEPDAGMYDALAKGLALTTGAVTCYINAGDLLSPHAFDIVLNVLENPTVSWVTGFDAYYNVHGHLIGFRLPFRYRRRLMSAGVYGTKLPAVQQESTFWRSSLSGLIDLDQLRSYRLAGDHYLWRCFSEQHELVVVGAYLGGFRYHGDHLSADMAAYRAEMRRSQSGPTLFDKAIVVMDKCLWRAPDKIKKICNPSLLRYDRHSDTWR